MKAILTLMTIAIVMASIGMVAAVGTPEDGLLIGMTTQEYVDYYGMLYLEGDRSKCTVETLALYAEDYGIHPTMDIYATATVIEVAVVPDTVETSVTTPEPTIQIVEEPEVLPVTSTPVATTDSNTTLMIIVCVILIAGIVFYIFSRQDKSE
jgi:hypothetical protein